MKYKLPIVCLILLLAILNGNDSEAKGGGGGRGGGGRGGGGRGSGGMGRSGTGKSRGGKLSTGKKVGVMAGAGVGVGVALYAGYRGYKSAHSKNKHNDTERNSTDFDADEWNGEHHEGDEGRMSAFEILLVLAVIGILVWRCYSNWIGLPHRPPVAGYTRLGDSL